MNETHPEIAATINEYYMPASKSASECGADADAHITYIASWIAQAEVSAEKPKYNISIKSDRAALIDDENIRGTSIRWDNYLCEPFELKTLDNRPEDNDAEFQTPPSWMLDAKLAAAYEKDFITWLSRDADMTVLVNEKLAMSTEEENMSLDEFVDLCKEKASELSQKEVDKLTKSYETKLKALQSKLDTANINLQDKESAAKARKLQTGVAVAETVLGIFGVGRKKSVSTSVNKAGQISTAQNALEKAQMKVNELTEQFEALQDELESKVEEITEKWDEIAENTSEVKVDVAKKDIYVDAFGICWFPYYINEVGKLVKAY